MDERVHILDHIPFRMDLRDLMNKLHMREESSHLSDLERLLGEASAIARPKVLYKVSFIDSKEDEAVVIDGIKLRSRVLRVNLEEAQRVFPYVATCGVELAEWADGIQDMLEHYWAETIEEMALRVAMKVLDDHLNEHYRPGRISRMSPGSLEDWPIQEQEPLFALLGNKHDTIGVRLTESFLMIPLKSLSGLYFPTEVSFESCQLCSRELCPSRRAPYDKDLYEKRYRPLSTSNVSDQTDHGKTA